MRLIDELRGIMPEIVEDAEAESRKIDDFFSRKAERTAKAIYRAIFATELPRVDLPEMVRGWQWCARSLFEDIAPMIGSNAAVRFIAAAIPKLCGETPKAGSVQAWLKQKKDKGEHAVIARFDSSWVNPR